MPDRTEGLNKPRTFAAMFPEHRGVVQGDGYVDRVTGPRCMVRMSEGPHVGRYIIARTDIVLGDGAAVLINDRLGHTRAALTPEAGHGE
ncbi:MAG: hypothetical protein Q8R82_06680 [Hyphomonadaceae bacterium]|nr:hypothetical protein [Hyphomonadaceae bacterium]